MKELKNGKETEIKRKLTEHETETFYSTPKQSRRKTRGSGS